jgi:hypothetical protein
MLRNLIIAMSLLGTSANGEPLPPTAQILSSSSFKVLVTAPGHTRVICSLAVARGASGGFWGVETDLNVQGGISKVLTMKNDFPQDGHPHWVRCISFDPNYTEQSEIAWGYIECEKESH